MRLFKLAVLATIAGFVGRRCFTRNQEIRRVAYADGEATGGQIDVRNAGPAAMRTPHSSWDAVDEASDESFPASDPPALH